MEISMITVYRLGLVLFISTVYILLQLNVVFLWIGLPQYGFKDWVAQWFVYSIVCFLPHTYLNT